MLLQNITVITSKAFHPELGTLTNFNYRDRFVAPLHPDAHFALTQFSAVSTIRSVRASGKTRAMINKNYTLMTKSAPYPPFTSAVPNPQADHRVTIVWYYRIPGIPGAVIGLRLHIHTAGP